MISQVSMPHFQPVWSFDNALSRLYQNLFANVVNASERRVGRGVRLLHEFVKLPAYSFVENTCTESKDKIW